MSEKWSEKMFAPQQIHSLSYRVHPPGVDTITIYPHDCTVGKSYNILIYRVQRTLNLPEPKNMKWQAQRALHLHSPGF